MNTSDEYHDAYEPPPPQSAGPKPPNGSAADYPYDPRLIPEMQVGLDKLRCVSDRNVAQNLYDLFWVIEAREKNGDAKRDRERDQRMREDAEQKRLAAIAEKAFRGGYGPDAKQLAAHILIAEGYGNQRRTDARSLREFESELRRLRPKRGALEVVR